MTQPAAAGELSGRIAIVTGGGSGIGAAVAGAVAEAGGTPVLFDLNRDAGESTAAALCDATGTEASSVVVDVTDRSAVDRAVAEVASVHGRIDILVNSAGWNQFRAPEELDQDNWRRIIAINLEGSWNACAAVMPFMIARHAGKIVNIGSSAALLAIPHAVPYSAAKHGVIGLTRALAIDLGPHGINVNCVCPGSTLTPLLAVSVSENFKERMIARTPLRRLGQPEEIAQAVLFLASDRASWISGVALPVDGGMVAGSRAEHWD
jgi:NAD(P)-dependent dehydrogenase (short-subunit alcohol dehydrogenase family)